jgi:thymidylate synthase (FAD)
MKQVLDHGYLMLIESWGSDERIIESARMSTGKGFLGWGPNCCDRCDGKGTVPYGPGEEPSCRKCGGTGNVPGDEKLLRHLWTKKHATPFEVCGLTVEVKAPIMVFREWHRHRTQSYNEMSARYTPLPDENYVPSVERLLLNAGTMNKQAGTADGAEILDESWARRFREDLRAAYERLESLYQVSLACGIPKELARLILPVGRYSRMRASANLRNWLAFLTLRMAPDAQWEIRQYANAVGELIADLFPRTWALFMESKQ